MSFPSELDGARLHSWATRAVAELGARRTEINALNVFPVPDADTGSNMTYTMEAALAEVDEGATDAAHVAAALARGAVRGARGNSGVVLSQVLRGVAEAASSGAIDGRLVARALTRALDLVQQAISDPVEGTVVTVLRAAALAAGEQRSLIDVATAAATAAHHALDRTPSQLPQLRGMVDAGGQGLVVLLDTLVEEIRGEQPPAAAAPASHHGGGPGAYLEVMFYYTGPKGADGAGLDAFGELAELGDSFTVAKDGAKDGADAGTVHLHTVDAGAAVTRAFALAAELGGQISQLRFEVLPTPLDKHRAIVAVTPPGSLERLYSDAGAIVVTPGPGIVTEIAARVREHGAKETILLPNGLLTRRELVAVEKLIKAFDQTITLVPTGRLVSGIAALAVYDPEQPLGVASYAMSEAAAAMRTVVLVRAEKAHLTTAGPCAKGDILATNPDVMFVADTVEEALLHVARHLLEPGGEQVTLLVRGDLVAQVEELDLGERLGVEVMVYEADNLGELVEIGVE